MDINKMRACSPLLPPPGGDVVCECLDEIERLRSIFRVTVLRLAPETPHAEIDRVLNGEPHH